MKPPAQEIVPLYTEKHLPSTVLAKLFNTTPATALRWLRSYGVAIRPTGRMAGKPVQVSTGIDVYLLHDRQATFLMKYPFQGHEPVVNDRILADQRYSIVERIWHQGQLRVLVVPAQ